MQNTISILALSFYLIIWIVLQVIKNEFILQILEDNKELKKNNQEFKKLLVEQNKKLNLTSI